MSVSVVGNLLRIGGKSFSLAQISSVEVRKAYVQLPFTWRFWVGLICAFTVWLLPVTIYLIWKNAQDAKTRGRANRVLTLPPNRRGGRLRLGQAWIPMSSMKCNV